jgi:HEAT repeat protein
VDPSIDAALGQLNAADEQTRADAALRLGRLKAARAVEPLARKLQSDSSPTVRDAAARALGLIADPSALSALQYAAQADNDREVRHSAQFAAEVIRSNLKGR